MKIINIENPEKYPRITNITIFDPWPFGTSSVQAGSEYGYLQDDGDYSSPDMWWLQNDGDNMLVEFSDGTKAVACKESVDAYTQRHSHRPVKW